MCCWDDHHHLQTPHTQAHPSCPSSNFFDRRPALLRSPPAAAAADPLLMDEALPATAAAVVVRAARASLREPTRPVTPADVGGARHLVPAGSSYTHRPSTSGSVVGSHEFLAACTSAPWLAGSCCAPAADIWTAPEEAPAGAAHVSRRTTTSAPSQQQKQQSLKGTLPALPRRPLPADGSTRSRAHSAGGGSRLSGLGALAPLQPLPRPLTGSSTGLGDAPPLPVSTRQDHARWSAGSSTSVSEALAVTARSSSSSSSRSSGAGSCLSRPLSSSTASRGSSRGGDNGRGSSSTVNKGFTKQTALIADEEGLQVDDSPCGGGDASAEHALAAALQAAGVWRRDVLSVVQRLQGMSLSASDAPAMLLACSELQCLLDTATDLGTLQAGLAAAAGDSNSSSVHEGVVRTLIRLVDSRRPDVLAKVGAMLLRVVPPGSAVLMPALKMLYALSKDSANDARFRHHGVLRPLLSTCAALSSSMQQQHAGTALLYCSGCLKNISADATNQKSLGRLSGVSTLSQVLAQQVAAAQPEQQPEQQETVAQVCLQVTALLRNLAVAPGNAALFAQHSGAALRALLSVLQAGFGSRDPALVLNVSRCLGKLSLHAGCQERLVNGVSPPLAGRSDQQQQPAIATCVGLLLQLDVAAPKQWPAAVRIAFALGNLTTSHAAARAAVAAVPGLLDGLPLLILGLVQHSQHLQETQPQQQLEASSAGVTAAAPTTATAAEAAAEELLTKLLRLLANVAIDASAGPALAAKQDTADALAAVLGGYEFEAAEELVLTAAAALTNLAFYDTPCNQLLQMDADSVLLHLLPLLTSGSEEAMIEAARAVGNLTRASPAARAALLACSEGPQQPVSEQAGAHAARLSAGPYVLRSLVLLLDHSSWEVVSSVAGALVNLTAAAQAGAALRGAGVAAALTAALQHACDSAASDSMDLAEEALACREEAVLLLLQCVANVAASSAAVVSDAVSGAAGPRCAEVSCSSADLTAFSAVVALLASQDEHGGALFAGRVQQMAQHVAQRLSQDWGV